MSEFEDIFQPYSAKEIKKRAKKYPLQCHSEMMIFSTPVPSMPSFAKELKRHNKIIRRWFNVSEFLQTSRHASAGILVNCTT